CTELNNVLSDFPGYVFAAETSDPLTENSVHDDPGSPLNIVCQKFNSIIYVPKNQERQLSTSGPIPSDVNVSDRSDTLRGFERKPLSYISC
ncbi:hypothetical protein J6590_087955, partial [Homalodisca vitripennis]